MLQVIKNISHIATPNTISSNAEKLKRGVSRDSEMHFNNGTLINFGLATQSTRSTSMKTPLMFAQTTNAKLRDINNQWVAGLASLNKDHRGANASFFSPPVYISHKITELSPSGAAVQLGLSGMGQANRAVLRGNQLRHR